MPKQKKPTNPKGETLPNPMEVTATTVDQNAQELQENLHSGGGY